MLPADFAVVSDVNKSFGVGLSTAAGGILPHKLPAHSKLAVAVTWSKPVEDLEAPDHEHPPPLLDELDVVLVPVPPGFVHGNVIDEGLLHRVEEGGQDGNLGLVPGGGRVQNPPR